MTDIILPGGNQQWNRPPAKQIKVLFVGDKPSKHNTDPDVAFEGTRSMTTLLTWIEFLGLSLGEYRIINRNHPSFETTVSLFNDCAIIALGEEASKALNAIEEPHFKLPHPSGLNRKLNDHYYVQSILRECRFYINGPDKRGF